MPSPTQFGCLFAETDVVNVDFRACRVVGELADEEVSVGVEFELAEVDCDIFAADNLVAWDCDILYFAFELLVIDSDAACSVLCGGCVASD